PETLLLAILLDAIAANRHHFRSLVLADFSRDTNAPLKQVIEPALKSQSGRMALLLAARMAPLLMKEYQGLFAAQRLWQVPGAVAEYEPDLLAITAEILAIS